MDSTARTYPSDLEAEQRLLCSVMLYPHNYPKVASEVTKDDFYRPAHAVIFSAAGEVFAEHGMVDLNSLSERLKAVGRLDEIGGLSYLMELTCAVASDSALDSHVKTVKDYSVRRSVITLAAEMDDAARRPGVNVDRLVSDAATSTVSLSLRTSRVRPTSPNAAADKFLTASEVKHDDSFPLGIKAIDSFFQGFRRGEFTVFAARPGAGKSVIILNLLKRLAEHGKKTLLMSMEMSIPEITDRLCAQSTLIPINRVRARLPADVVALSGFMGTLSSWEGTVLMDESPQVTPDSLEAKCREARESLGGLDFVLIDYLGLMEMPGRGEKWERLGNISRRMKILAKTMGINVVAAHQVNRESDKQRDSRPRLSNLADSSSVERDSDHVFLIHRKSLDSNVREDELLLHDKLGADFILAKNRHGPTGEAKVRFDGETSRFFDFMV